MKEILFARYSIIQCLILVPEIRKIQKIKFQPLARSNDHQNVYHKRITSRLIKYINPECIIEEFNPEIFNDESWIANRNSMNLIIQQEEEYNKNGLVIFLKKVINSKKVIKYFQGVFTYFYPASLAFESVTNKIDDTEEIFFIHAWEIKDTTKNQIGFLRSNLLKIIYGFQNLFQSLIYLIVVLFFPLLYLILRLKKGFNLGYSDKKTYTLSMPVLWGFKTNGQNIRNGVLKIMDDSYLYGEGLEAGEILHVFGKWPINSKTKNQYINEMKSNSYSFIDKVDFKLSFKSLLIIASTQIKILFYYLIAILGVSSNRESVILSKSLIKAIYIYLEKNLELTNIKCKAELVKNDYNPGHVIDAIVLKKFGIKSFGVQHAGTPLDCPQLSFVEFDFYSIWGDFYLKAFHQGWSKINLLKTGREIIDFLININNDRARVESIENEIVNNYGQSKARVIFLFSSPTYLTKKRMWEELHKGFIEIKKLTFDFQIICRFREESHKSHPYIKNTYELIVNDPRFILEQIDFTTQELMTISDLVITPNTSFGINEALAIKKKVYTFDLIGNASITLKNYANNIVLKSSEDLVNVIEELNNESHDLSYNVNNLSHDLNYHSDGKNCLRLREKIINETISG